MCLTQSLKPGTLAQHGPQYYMALSGRRLRGRKLRDAMGVARDVLAEYRSVRIYNLNAQQRYNRAIELLDTAVMLERLSELPRRWYVSRLTYNSRRGLIARHFREVAGLLGHSERELRQRCRVTRPDVFSKS